MTLKTVPPRWIPGTLFLAGCYNVGWAGWVLSRPNASLELLGYSVEGAGPMFWQGVAMLVGVFGIGYLVAATNPVRHWLVIFLGLISKLLAGAGGALGAMQGTMPAITGWLAIPNDIIWWIPFSLILWYVWKTERRTVNVE